MRCLACNCILSDFESTRKNEETGQYEDLCNECFAVSNDAVVEHEDMLEIEYDEDEYQKGWHYTSLLVNELLIHYIHCDFKTEAHFFC